MIRLQGQEWHSIKNNMTVIGYQKSGSNNIRIITKKNGDITTIRYFHWLNPEEKKKFEDSEFYKTHNEMTLRELKDENRAHIKANQELLYERRKNIVDRLDFLNTVIDDAQREAKKLGWELKQIQWDLEKGQGIY